MKTSAEILLGRILQIMITKGYSQMNGYNRFTYISHTNDSLKIGREKGLDTDIPFSKLLVAIRNYQLNPEDYRGNTTTIRDYGISHIYSPIFSMLHLLDKKDYMHYSK